MTAETCKVCGAELTVEDGRRYRKVHCPAGCTTGFRPPPPDSFINDHGDLVIPVHAPAKYLHQKGGQTLWATLAELNAPLTTWRKYAYEQTQLLDGRHERVCRATLGNGNGFVFCVQCG